MQHMKTTLIKREKKEEETGDYKWQMENPATSIHAYSWPLFSDTILKRRLTKEF